MATSMSMHIPAATAMPPPPTPPPQRRQSNSKPSTQSTTPTATQSSISTATDGATLDAAEEDGASGEAADADVSKPGMDATMVDHTYSFMADGDFGDDDHSTPGELEQRIFELEASGWRPPEEMVADSAEDDDDDYNEVDLMSDNEEEDSSLRRREEQLLTAEERFTNVNTNANVNEQEALARRLSLSSQGSNDSDVAYMQFNDNILFSSETPWSQSFQHLHPDNLVDYGNVFNDDTAPGEQTPLARKTTNEDPLAAAAGRRVRFEDEVEASDSDTTDSEDEQDLFPDLFVQQDQLDAGFRADIEADVHDLYMDDNSDAGSCWDFDADEARILMMDDEDDDGSSDSDNSSAGSSGYESDDGDTTDEEEVELPPEKIKQAAEKAAAEAEAEAASRASATPKQVKNARAKIIKRSRAMTVPQRGRFILDAYKPIVTVDCEVGKPDKIRFWPARKATEQQKEFWKNAWAQSGENADPSRTASRTTSPLVSVHMTPTEYSDSNVPSRQNSIDSANMLDAFFDEGGRLRADQIVGPAEAFMPQMDLNGYHFQDDMFQNPFDTVSGAEDENDPMASFVDFGDDDEDDEMPDESDNLMSPSASQSQSFTYMSNNTPTSKSAGFDLLAHLDAHRGVVGSFRRNQQIAKHVGSLPSHPALRASASETNAMQTGRRAAANTPITPLRKKKAAKGVGARNSPITTSPLHKSPPLKRKGPLKGGFSR